MREGGAKQRVQRAAGAQRLRAGGVSAKHKACAGLKVTRREEKCRQARCWRETAAAQRARGPHLLQRRGARRALARGVAQLRGRERSRACLRAVRAHDQNKRRERRTTCVQLCSSCSRASALPAAAAASASALAAVIAGSACFLSRLAASPARPAVRPASAPAGAAAGVPPLLLPPPALRLRRWLLSVQPAWEASSLGASAGLGAAALGGAGGGAAGALPRLPAGLAGAASASKSAAKALAAFIAPAPEAGRTQSRKTQQPTRHGLRRGRAAS